MTRDEIIKMASMAGFETKNGMVWVDQWEVTRTIERFFHAAYAAGAAAEREACASICDRFQARNAGMQPAECAAAIRARSEK